MRKAIIVLLITLSIGSIITSAYAGGDKVRGDKGKGGVVQAQVRK